MILTAPAMFIAGVSRLKSALTHDTPAINIAGVLVLIVAYL
jgi:hypothetical protein